MSFFLIGKGPDGTLTLLSEHTFDTRQGAMAALSRLTAEDGFDLWEHEVVVADLQGATPVLLVRPASSQPVAPEPAPEEPAEEPVPEEPAEEPVPEEPAEEPVPEEPAEEPVPEEPAEEPVPEEPVPEEPAEEPADESLAAVLEGLADEDAGPPDLKEALKRTTASLEAEGIVAPESVGPAEEVESRENPPQESPQDSEPSDAMVVEAAPEPSWPWTTKDASRPFELDALEDPGYEEGSLVRSPGDDDTIAASRPVILGSYQSEEAAAEDASAATAEQPAGEEAGVPPIPVPPPIPAVTEPSPTDTDGSAEFSPSAQPSATDVDPASSMGAADEGASGKDTDSGVSDYVDLDSASVGDIDTMTCEECVYMETCPNKGQRAPASCGSFQWK